MAKKVGQSRITNIPTKHNDRIGRLSEKSNTQNASNNMNYRPGEVIITNPDVLEIVQNLRKSKVGKSPGSIRAALASDPGELVAQRLFTTTDTQRVTAKINVRDKDISGKTINLRLTVKDDREFEIEKKNFKIDHGSLRRHALLKSTPPDVNMTYRNGKLVVSIEQRDPLAEAVNIYLRSISIDGRSSYTLFQQIPAYKEMGTVEEYYGMNISEPTMFRAIGLKKGKLMDAFTDSVVFPELNSGDLPTDSKITTIDSMPQDAVVTTFCQHDERGNPSIVIQIDSIQSDALHMTIVKRVVEGARRGEFRSLIMQPIRLKSSRRSTYEIRDDNVVPGETYEYRCKFTEVSGVEKISSHSGIETPRRATPGAGFIIGGKKNTPVLQRSSKAYVAQFTLSPIIESSYMSILTGLVQSIDPTLYNDKLSGMSDFLNSFIAFKCERIDTRTGIVDDLGIYYPGQFTDRGNPAKGISPPRAGRKYYYKVEMIIRDMFQTIEEVKNISSYESEKLANNNPVPYANQAGQKVEISPRGKHLSPYALMDGVLVYGRAMRKYPGATPMEAGKTGIQQIVTFSLPMTKPSIRKASVKMGPTSMPIITWVLSPGDMGVDHFIIMAKRSGYKHPVGVGHHAISLGYRSGVFIDKTQTIPGVVSYSVIPVYTDYTRGKESFAGKVVIGN